MSHHPFRGILTALLLFAAVDTAYGQSWPRWRGPQYDGKAASAKPLFDRPFELRVRWKRKLGTGYSGVVVDGGRAVTMFSDGKSDFLVALNAETGDEQWRVALGPTYTGRDGSTDGPSSTPTIHENVVYAIGPWGEMVAVDATNGKERWKRHLAKEFDAAVPHWGFTTSPMIAGDLVVVLAGGSNNRAVVALNLKTGQTAWTAIDDTVSYQSPLMATIGGRQQIVGAGDRFIFGLDPATGKELWRHAHGGTGFYGRIINPLVIGEDLLLTYKPDESVLLTAGGSGVTPGWSTRELKLNYAPPVLHENLVFGYSGAFLSAIDRRTGVLKWRSREPGDGFHILVDGHLVVMTKEGQLAVAPADDKGFNAKASIELFSRLTWTPPAFANGRIYARDSYEEIAAVDVVPAARMTDAGSAPRRGVIPGSRFAQWVAEVERAPDAQARVSQFLAAQKSVPIVEGDRYAHFLFAGGREDLLLRADSLGTGTAWPMHRVGSTDLYYASIELEPDARIGYQFVRGLGETLADPRNPLKTTSLNMAGDVSVLFMPRADRTLPPDPTGKALKGKIVEHAFDGGEATAAHLRWTGKRAVKVYLPPGYDADTAARYPAIYVMYGEQMLTDGRLAAALDDEFGRTIQPAIVVFVPTTSGFEYARTFRPAHAKMMGERLVPWIDKQYRTRASADGRILMGGDEAGFAAVEVPLLYPQVFGAALAQSIFPLSGGDDELIALIDKASSKTQRFHVDWGRYDPRRASDQLDIPGFSERVHKRLAAAGFRVTGGPTGDGSAMMFWTTRAVKALQGMLPVK